MPNDSRSEDINLKVKQGEACSKELMAKGKRYYHSHLQGIHTEKFQEIQRIAMA